MADMATEEQIRELVARMQAYQSRLEMLQQQANFIQLSLNDIDNALKALGSLEEKEEGHEMLVPIGANSYVYATISNPSRVLIGIGAGISVEKSADDSKAILSSRRTEMEKILVETSGAINQVTNELMRLQQEAEKYR
ncbi:prefoldin subunit alpha [Methanocella sp. CWC-04]|uniref:Prefoldin subunit alpha n=1 Tax=Methanooceanicella nereidis TaxID=2052831 RepID=A0AAP2REI7_9EURY|nr:prefoldin subunit alpha [Methanocella sp. CWC-04]MCD1295326.1 prefoldin subunit alpha [Methanocella sp. CWC-04]